MMRPGFKRAWWRGGMGFALVAMTFACTEGTTADHGDDADLTVSEGTFFRGAFPAEGTGPSVLAVNLSQISFKAGYQGKSFSGVLEEGAVAAAIALEGDIGYYTVDAGSPNPENPIAPTFDAPLSFSSNVEPGQHRLLVWALDADGHVGKMASSTFTLLSTSIPSGDLVFTLTWDTEADLDLSVRTPQNVLISSANPSSTITVPGKTTDTTYSGALDRDSNKDCVIDGYRQEDIVFSQGALSGRYLAYMSAVSLCGETMANYQVNVYAQGVLLGSTTGTVTASDMAYASAQSGKTLVLDVALP